MIREEGERPLGLALSGCDPLGEQPMALVYVNEAGVGGTLDLAGRTRTTIGRDGTCDIVFRDAHVSRIHATIDLVEGQHLLRDNGSSNGTFLNGLRLNNHHSFALRGRDVIEIGSQRIRFVRSGFDDDKSTGIIHDGGTHDAADLVKDGYEALDPAARSGLAAAVLRAFADVPAVRGLQLTLPYVLERLQGHAAAVFREDARHGVRTVAALPNFETGGTLVALALRAWRDRRGHVVRGVAPLDPQDFRKTCVQDATSSAAVPLMDGVRPRGVLAVYRADGPRLARGDLAHLAVIADHVARTLALKDSKAPGDTRT